MKVLKSHSIFKGVFRNTLNSLWFDLRKFRARLYNLFPKQNYNSKYLHLGCGNNKVVGWINADLTNSDVYIDLSYGNLPFTDGSMKSVVMQHVIEHLSIENDIIPLFKEIFRILELNGEIWLSCPDLEKVCKGYIEDKGHNLLLDRQKRYPKFSLNNIPVQHIINDLFHQRGEHKNLFDGELLIWALSTSGFTNCTIVNEEIFMKRFPEFPKRNDNYVSIYVKAIKQ